jgi:hypothetical protein
VASARPPSPADAVIIPPQLAPQSSRDAALGIAIGLLLAFVLFGLPTLVTLAAYRGAHQPLVVMGVWIVFFCPVALVAYATVVHSLRLDADGITFKRWWGVPRHLPWSEVRRIRRAPPREVVVRGWLWPPVPPREATRSMTAEGHYAIEYGAGKVTYYPPENEADFLTAARRWNPEVL